MVLLWRMGRKVQTGRYRAGTAGAFAGLVLVAALVLGTGAACAAEPTEATAAGPAGQWATKEAFYAERTRPDAFFGPRFFFFFEIPDWPEWLSWGRLF